MKINFFRLFVNILLVLSLALNGYFLYKKYKPKEKKYVSGGGGGLAFQDRTPIDDSKETESDPNNESFFKFYKSFNDDKNFQKERIKMPLEGKYYQDYDTEIKWDKETWLKYGDFGNIDDIKPKDLAKEIEMWVYVPNSGYQFKNTFKMIEGKWYLVKSKSCNL